MLPYTLAVNKERAITIMRLSVTNIKKTDEDHYHVRGEFIDEHVNGSQLLGMLSGKYLVGTTPDAVLRLLDEQGVGYETTITYKTVLGE